MTTDDMKEWESDYDISLREVDGGWILKYLEGFDEDDDPIYNECVFIDQTELCLRVSKVVTDLKEYRSKSRAKSVHRPIAQDQ